MKTTLEVNADDAARFITALTGARDTPATFQWFPDKKGSSSVTPGYAHGPLDALWSRLVKLNAAGAGIFVMINQGDGKGRSNANVTGLRALFVDDDSNKLNLDSLPLEPSLTVRSKHGLHVYWRINPGESLDRFDAAQMALAQVLGTDSAVKDLCRVMRVPGFLHVKDPANPFMVQVIQTSDVQFTIDTVLSVLGATNVASPDKSVSAPIVTGSDPVLQALLQAKLYLKPTATQGKHFIVCPWQALHTNQAAGPTDAVYSEPGTPNAGFHCSHSHCSTRHLRDLRAYLGVIADSSDDEEQPTDRFALPDRVRPGADLFDIAYPPLEFAIAPYFPLGELIEVSGACGIFKSTAMISACLSIATGQAWCGHAPIKGKALFLTMEDIAPTLARRVRAWLEGLPPGRAREDAEHDVRENFIFLPREDSRGLATTYSSRGETTPRQQVIQRIQELSSGCRFVVLETAARLHAGAEDNESLAVFAGTLEEIATKTGAAVVLVRHVAKEVARKQLVDAYSGRGGASLSDAARSILVMTKEKACDDELEEDEEEGRLRTVMMTHVKSTHTQPGPRLLWKPVSCEYGVYLQKVLADEQLRRDMKILQAHIEESEGLSQRDIKHHPPEPLSSRRALAALVELATADLIAVKDEKRGKNLSVLVYYGHKHP